MDKQDIENAEFAFYDEAEEIEHEERAIKRIEKMKKYEKEFKKLYPNGSHVDFQKFVISKEEGGGVPETGEYVKIDRGIIEELLFAIMNVSHAEYHLIELAEYNIDKGGASLSGEITRMRNNRVALMNRLSEHFPNVNPAWCTVKHLLLSHFHLMELYEKSLDKFYLELAKDIYLELDELLVSDKYKDFTKCSRCEE